MISSTQMTTSATSSAASAVKTASKTQEMANFNSFLQLLTTEMKNQDPLKPLDPTQTVTQLATFSGIEQAVKTNTLLTTLVQNSSGSQAASLIGRTLSTAQGNTLGVIAAVTTQINTPVALLGDGSSVPLTSDAIIS